MQNKKIKIRIFFLIGILVCIALFFILHESEKEYLIYRENCTLVKTEGLVQTFNCVLEPVNQLFAFKKCENESSCDLNQTKAPIYTQIKVWDLTEEWLEENCAVIEGIDGNPIGEYKCVIEEEVFFVEEKR